MVIRSAEENKKKRKKLTPDEMREKQRRTESSTDFFRRREKLANRQGISSKAAGRILAEGSEAEALREDVAARTGESREKKIVADPSSVGLNTLGQEPTAVPGVEVLDGQGAQEQVAPKDRGALDVVKDLFGNVLEKDPFTGETRTDPETGEPIQVAGQPVAIGASAAIPAWKVGKTLFTNPQKAVQAANTAKTVAKTTSLGKTIRDWSIGIYAGLKSIEGVANFFTGRKVDEQQKAINTIGQEASTLGGQATEGTGDWQKGLAELQFLRKEVLRMESAIKAGKIQSFSIRFNGKIFDLDADVSDQLRTIEEQITKVQTFAFAGSFPDLSPFELQALLRKLEDEGSIEPVDLTGARRPTDV